MSENYNYEYENEDANAYSYENQYDYDNTQYDYNNNQYSEEGKFDEVSLPPPPPATNSWNSKQTPTSTPPPPPPVINKTVTQKKKKDPPKLTELEGWRAYQLLGIYSIGNIPFPFINPNFFKHMFHSGHYVVIPVSLFELLFIWVALLVNVILNWFYLAGALVLGVQYPPYTAVRIINAHISFIVIPLAVLSKYVAIYKACTESTLIVKATLYLTFIVLAAVTMLMYLSMYFGLLGSGFFTGLILFIGGLVKSLHIFPMIVGVMEILGTGVWFLLLLCCFVQIGGMIRSFIIYRKAQIEAKNALQTTV